MKFKDDIFYINQVLSGDQSAFTFLVEKHKENAFTLAKRLAKNDADAEEILQDSFIKVYRSLNSFKNEARFSSWLYRIVYNTGISFLRKKNTITSSFDDDFMEPEVNLSLNSGFVDISERDQNFFIKQALESLKPEDSFILSLYYFDDHNSVEIAKILDISESNVRIKLHRARKKMQKQLECILQNEADLRLIV